VVSLKQSDRCMHLLVKPRGAGWGLDPESWKSHSLGKESFKTVDLLLHRLKQQRIVKHSLQENSDNLGTHARDEMKQVLDAKQTIVDQSVRDNINMYIGRLSALIDKGSILPSELSNLRRWREANNITEEHHEAVCVGLEGLIFLSSFCTFCSF